MTRDEIKKLFPEATDEQISSLLSSHHSELNRLKDDNKALKEKADKFDAAERDKLSKEEQLQTLLDEANAAKAENLRLLNRTKAAAKLAAAGLSEEESAPILDGFVSDDEARTMGFAETLAKVIGTTSERAAAKEKQSLLQTPPPVSGTAPTAAAPDFAEQFVNAAKANDMLSMIKAADGMTAAKETKV